MRIVSLSFEQLLERGVCEPFARLLTEPEAYHPDLSILVGKANWDYFIPAGVTEVVPLWDSNADSVVRWNRDGLVEFVRLYHDDPRWELEAKSEQGIMAFLWQQWFEFQEDDDAFGKFADGIGFQHGAEAFKLWSDDIDRFEEWRQNLVA